MTDTDTAFYHLGKLLDAGWETTNEYAGYCFYCGEDEGYLGEECHKGDCPYVAAKLFLETHAGRSTQT
jgi:hypothetical protein